MGSSLRNPVSPLSVLILSSHIDFFVASSSFPFGLLTTFLCKNLDSSVGIATRLRDERSGF
jgi:hypothetical protein